MTREAYRPLEVYRTEAPLVDINLADNTNAFGSAPSAIATLSSPASLSAYPPVGVVQLREALAKWLHVEPENVVCGCGSNDIIDASMRAFAEPGARFAFASPTFVMAPHFARANSLEPTAVPVGPRFEIDADALIALRAPLVYIASPNNPSGTLAEATAVERLLDETTGTLVLDEAYAEFAGVSWIREAVRRPNVLVTRTFSKAWGLAGLRIGYGIGSAPLVTELEKARGPFKVNTLAERAARMAVECDEQWLETVVGDVRASRDRFIAALRDRGFSPYPSAANFVAVPVPDAVVASKALAVRGIAVRAFPGADGRAALLRITIAPAPIMDRVMTAMEDLPR